MESLAEYCHRVQIGHYSVNYVKFGSGPIPIFCFPGLLGSLRHSNPKLLEKLGLEEGGTKYTCYTWDPPGYYLSRPPLRKEEHISFDIEVDVSSELLKYLEPTKTNWILIGWSAGNQVALGLTTKFPKLIQKLILWGAWDSFGEDHLPTHLQHRDLKLKDSEMLKKQLEEHDLVFEEYEKHWTGWMDMIQREFFEKDRTERFRNLTEIQCATLIIAGSNDPLAVPAHSQRFHAHIKNSRLEILEGATHQMPTTHPTEIYSLICNFLNNSG